MFTKKISLFSIAALTLGVAAAACSGGDDDDSTYTMSSGEYDLDITDVPTNSCWPTSNPLPLDPTQLSLPIEIIATETTFQLVMPEEVSDFLPSVDGTIDGNDLAADGQVDNYLVGTTGGNCAMDAAATADGELTGNDEFNATVTVTLTVTAPDSCAGYVGEALPGTMGAFPFPTLTNGSTGTCTIALVADGVLSE